MTSWLHRKPTRLILAGLIISLVAFMYVRHRTSSPDEQQLSNVENDLNELYRAYRPFPYRWSGAPYAPETTEPKRIPAKLLGREVSAVDRSELLLGRTALSSRLRGRIHLLSRNYEEAIAIYRLAALQFPEDGNLKLELSIAFAMRAQAEHRALDYERALETVLGIDKVISNPEVFFDEALLFEQVPLPEQALHRWQGVVSLGEGSEWGREAEKRLSDSRNFLEARGLRIRHLINSPSSYLAHANEASASLELVVETAIADWLPVAKRSQVHAQALAYLANALETRYQDPWLSDLLQVSANGTAAMHALSESWKANSRGYHVRGEHFAAQADSLFRRTGNVAGVLRSRVELVYALDRQQRPAECMRALSDLRSAAHRRHYVWIEGQSWLEEITCQTESRKTEVIAMRNQAYQWISKTGYEALRLRALSFLTEDYVSFGSQLSVWERGHDGLASFWNAALPPGRGYTFYYTMANSARAAGSPHAALSLLREGISLLESSPHQQLLALVLSHRAAWEWESGLYTDSYKTFDRMESLFAQFSEHERRSLWHEAQIMRANAEIAAGKPKEALLRLANLTKDMDFPFSSLSPIERRQLLPTLGDAYLATGSFTKAEKCYGLIITEAAKDLRLVSNRIQRENAQREIESAWKGITEISLLHQNISLSWKTWEEYRSTSSKNQKGTRPFLPEDTTILTYAFLPSGLSAWVIQQNDVHQQWLDGKNIKGKLERFTALVADRNAPFSDVRSLAKELYSVLVQPLQSYLVQTHFLGIDAESPLAAVPWSALIDEHGAFLVSKFAIFQTKGWSKLNVQTVDLSRPLIVADPSLGNELASQYRPLPDARREALYLQSVLPGSVFIHDEGATLSALVRLLPRSTLLHFGGHGVSYGGFGALLLAPEAGEGIPARLVTAGDIGNIKLAGLQLVVLAACSSGAGEQSDTVNLDSLVQGFLRAGAQRVVAAQWNVSSSETSDTMQYFYEALLRGQRPAEALRVAMAQVSRKASTRHPYYWAAFQMFGKS